ncbi:MAG: HlyD family secretion protein [Acetobacteraceae bacterium]
MKRRLVLPVLLLLVLGAAGAAWWCLRADPPTYWQGYAEADYVYVAPVLTGRLVRLSVARGDKVAAGAPLFDQDDTNERAAHAAAAANLAQAQANLANLLAPSRAAEIAQDVGALAEQRAGRDQAADDLARDERVVASGAVTRQKVDQEHLALAAAEARVAQARAKLAQARLPTGRAEQIAATRTAVAAARGALAQAAWQLAQRHVTAPVAALVSDTDAREGETVAAGATVVELLPPENIRVRFFVPERALAGIHPGARMEISCDGCGQPLVARVSFVAPQPEYTPPVIYSAQTRATLVYMIEARPELAQAMRLKPGQPVEVRPLGAGSGR